MVSTRPDVDPQGYYCVGEIAAALGVDRHTVRRWGLSGAIKFRVRKAGRRKVASGAQVIKAWESML